ncbi:hypothetical protein FRC09_018257 [Ceratobasidium sp. 395]|nr:hypothetical protein FRC09_018257 [Ceratobasidium sp. 395]
MPKTLSGNAAIGAGPCDPRCTKPRHQGDVSKRVRRNCKRELDLAERMRAANTQIDPATSSNTRSDTSANK